MKPKKIITSFILFFVLSSAFSQNTDYQSEIYKTIDTVQLEIRIFKPQNESKNIDTASPAIVFFFGGGWNGGSITQFEPQAKYLSKRGMTAITVEYRTRDSHRVAPYQCVEDAKSAMRYIRGNAERLGIDPMRIVASGGSAGGHLAAATAFVDYFDWSGDDFGVSPKPNALVLFNPVIDNSQSGYGYDRVKDYWAKFSPMHNICKDAPPTIIFLGTKDRLIPVSTVEEYKRRMDNVSSRCELRIYDEQPHGFFNYNPQKADRMEYYKKILIQTDLFLISLGYLSGKPMPEWME